MHIFSLIATDASGKIRQRKKKHAKNLFLENPKKADLHAFSKLKYFFAKKH